MIFVDYLPHVFTELLMQVASAAKQLVVRYSNVPLLNSDSGLRTCALQGAHHDIHVL
jgi:hypothetical protein